MLVILLLVIAVVAALMYFFGPGNLPQGVGLKPIPIVVRSRDSLMLWGSQVMVLQNESQDYLHDVKAVCTSIHGETQEHTWVKWEPGESEEIGALQGWVWTKDETITLSADGYASKTWTNGGGE